MSSALGAPSVGGAGATIAVTVTTKNQGNGHADPSVTRFYLSSNSVLDAADALLTGEQAVPALLGRRHERRVRVGRDSRRDADRPLLPHRPSR